MTEQKQNKDQLLKQLRTLEKAHEIGGVGTWNLDVVANTLVWNRQTYKNFGISADTPASYELFLACVHPDDQAYVRETWTAALKGEPYDIEHRIIVDGVALIIGESARDKGLQVDCSLDSVPARVVGDKIRLRQALLNYAYNAVKFTDKGRVILRASLLEDDGDELLVRFEVEDTGIGIEPDKIGLLLTISNRSTPRPPACTGARGSGS